MDVDELYQIVAERNVCELFVSLDFQLELLPPDGKTIHRRNCLRHGLVGRIENYSYGLSPKGETVREWKERDGRDCEGMIKELAKDIDLGLAESLNKQIYLHNHRTTSRNIISMVCGHR